MPPRRPACRCCSAARKSDLAMGPGLRFRPYGQIGLQLELRMPYEIFLAFSLELASARTGTDTALLEPYSGECHVIYMSNGSISEAADCLMDRITADEVLEA